MERFEAVDLRTQLARGHTMQVLSSLQQFLEWSPMKRKKAKELSVFRDRLRKLTTELSAISAKTDFLDADFIAHRQAAINQDVMALLVEMEKQIAQELWLGFFRTSALNHKADKADLEITLKKDFSTFSEEEQQEFMEAIGNLLKMNRHNIKITRLDGG